MKNQNNSENIKNRNATLNVFDVISVNDSLLESCNKIINDLEEWNSHLRALHEQNSHLYLREIKIHEPPSDPLERRKKKKTIDPLPVTLEQLNYDFKYGEYPLLPDRVIKERNSKNIPHYRRLQMNTKPDPTLEINQIRITEPNSFSSVPNLPSSRRKNPRGDHIRRAADDNNKLNSIDQMYEHLNRKSPRNSNRISVQRIQKANQRSDKDQNQAKAAKYPDSKNQNSIHNSNTDQNNKKIKYDFPSLPLNSLSSTNYDNKRSLDDISEGYKFDGVGNYDSNDSLAMKKRKLRLQKKTIQTAQSSRQDRSISIPHKLRSMEYKAQPSSSRFPACQSISDHQETKLKIEKLEIRFQETMEKAVRHIQKLNRQMDKKYGTKSNDDDYH